MYDCSLSNSGWTLNGPELSGPKSLVLRISDASTRPGTFRGRLENIGIAAPLKLNAAETCRTSLLAILIR